MSRMAGVVVLALGAMLSGCGGDKSDDAEKGSVSVKFDKDHKEATAIGDDDVKITSTDGALVLAVVSDSVILQLSDSLRNSVADSIARNTQGKGNISAMIGSAVSAAVGTAMGFQVKVPAKDVENLRYEDGELKFDVKGGKVVMNSKSSGSSKSNGGRFSEADAQKFIDAVKAAQSHTLQM